MGAIDSRAVLLLCGSGSGRLPRHGNGRRCAASRLAAAGVATVAVAARPGRADLDPLLAAHNPRRLVVAGTDADLAAVLVRLLRTERHETIEVAYLPAERSSAAAAAWGLPRGRSAVDLALHGRAYPVPLVRDDSGGVLVGRGEIANLRGEVYCDDTLVLRGTARRLVVVPTPSGIAVRAGWGRSAPDGTVRPVPARAPTGRGSGLGRAVQVGCAPATVVTDGVTHPRAVPRWTWYRHTSDWLLVRPAAQVSLAAEESRGSGMG